MPPERFRMLPAPLAARALSEGLTARLLVTDAGVFPRRAGRGMTRPRGAPETIVIICREGAGRVWAGGQSHQVRANDAIVLPQHEPHGYRSDPRDPWGISWFHANGLDVPELTRAALGPDRQLVGPLRDGYAVLGLVEQVMAALERDETESSLLAASGAAWHVFARIAADRRLGPAGTNDRVSAVRDHLRQNFRTTPSVAELARLTGLSTSHFAALFRKATGMGVLEYVKRLRNAHARELLVTTDLPVAEVSRSAGYADPFYFSRQFHAINGVSPSGFRAQQRGED
ncbi:helix-turn-helix domain-containing protein [Kutzneria sp. NPDC052558]|uniref:AraC family transcriptional regulator n=1 Tax=Kutzneria sp. NPDC052558 TaxID=3364121 RepID=UPI0037CC524C